MICPNCGFDIPDGYKFCPNCGNDVRGIAESSQVYFSEPVNIRPEQVNPANMQGYVNPNAPRPGKVLALGIVSLALSFMPIANIAAIIIAIICINKAGQINVNGMIISKQARIGRNLAIAAIPCAIVFTFVWIVYFIALYELIEHSTPGNYYNYFRY